jgi:hypothetical protein
MFRQIFVPLALAAAFSTCGTGARAGILPVTSRSEFVSSIEPDFYQESFDGLRPNVPYTDSMAFSIGSFGYEIHTDGLGSNQGIYPLENQNHYGDIWFATNYDSTSVEISGFQGDVDAIGGEFFLTAFESGVASGVVTIFAEGADNASSYAFILNGSHNFVGFYATAGQTITRLTIELPSRFNYATLNDLIVGRRIDGIPLSITAVPEPSGFVIMGIGTLIAGTFLRRKFSSV